MTQSIKRLKATAALSAEVADGYEQYQQKISQALLDLLRTIDPGAKRIRSSGEVGVQITKPLDDADFKKLGFKKDKGTYDRRYRKGTWGFSVQRSRAGKLCLMPFGKLPAQAASEKPEKVALPKDLQIVQFDYKEFSDEAFDELVTVLKKFGIYMQAVPAFEDTDAYAYALSKTKLSAKQLQALDPDLE